jgi:protein ImuB
MSHWIALWPSPSSTEAQHRHLVHAALQFTPRVAWLAECLVLEVQASARLFGGLVSLHARLAGAVLPHGALAWARARTALAASAQARLGPTVSPLVEGLPAPHTPLAQLPLHSLDEVAEHAHALQRLGCQTLKDVLRLPREGLNRRFGAALVRALDQATGRLPMPLVWLESPAAFEARLELPHTLDNAPALMQHWAPLLNELARWLRERHLGVNSLELHWLHAWRNHEGLRSGHHVVRLSNPTQDAQQLETLVAEHLQALQWSAPVAEVAIHAHDLAPVLALHTELFQDAALGGTSHNGVLSASKRRARQERTMALVDQLSARLGGHCVLRPHMRADHRVEHSQHWGPALGVTRPAHQADAAPQGPATSAAWVTPHPQPTWLLRPPIRLPLKREGTSLRERPWYQGPLDLLAGPHRVEAGWWDESPDSLAVRDYYLASSAGAGLLWVFKTRPAAHEVAMASSLPSPWFLHGLFA